MNMMQLDSAYAPTLLGGLHYLRQAKLAALKDKLTDPVPPTIHVQTIKGIAAELQLIDDIQAEINLAIKGGEAAAC